ncbi:MAG: nitrous oxide reductase family maturation protein NosD [Xanthobacteraceae bacterium]|nr:MAG: nitrous oxide reductase family maturation protein NosD [Xanthobacteraceae bacterium]
MRLPRLALIVAAALTMRIAAAPAAQLPPLQPLIDATPTGGTLSPPPGRYAGPARIDRALTLDGRGEVTLENDGNGTVLAIEGAGITVQGMTLKGSGAQHEQLDAAIRARGRFLIIKDNRIENCLFGIDFQQTHNSVIRRNTISSLDDHVLPQKGDAIRLWYSNDNAVQDNVISGARDTVVWYSTGNKVLRNTMTGGQYGLHFMYAHDNLADGNAMRGNVVGIFVMFGNRNTLRNNRIEYSQGPSGIGIGFKEASGTAVENNDVLGNAVGMYFDASPYEPDLSNAMTGNRFAFNGIATHFHSDWEGNAFRGNDFISNHAMVVADGGGTARRNLWDGNHYDTYEGFDRNRDGIGDTPMEAWSWADQLWMDLKEARFFRGSPALETIDFMERLVPFSEPRLMLRDVSPRMKRVAGGAAPSGAGQ